MNHEKFSVTTPEEWKDHLYAKIDTDKRVRIRPAALLAAILIILGLSGSAFAVKVSKAPEYFGSLFLGDSEQASQVYSEKNYTLESSREDLSLTCLGIAGDDYDVILIFQLKSTGDVRFDNDCNYLFEVLDQEAPFMRDFGTSFSSKVIDERTLELEISYSAMESRGLVGKTFKFTFETLKEYSQTTKTIDCAFHGKVTIDYASSANKLKKTDNTVEINGIKNTPVKGTISNLNFDYTLTVPGIMDEYQTKLEKLIGDSLTIKYADGTSETFRIKMPPQEDNDAFAGSVGVDGNELRVQLRLPKLIAANQVIAVELNGVEIFTK
ncbi:MAG: hypothetical protein PUB43_09070 [Oscillospiraceae bacterium]|nr:hypothetical protein [Oscillospiraceae bacterium]